MDDFPRTPFLENQACMTPERMEFLRENWFSQTEASCLPQDVVSSSSSSLLSSRNGNWTPKSSNKRGFTNGKRWIIFGSKRINDCSTKPPTSPADEETGPTITKKRSKFFKHKGERKRATTNLKGLTLRPTGIGNVKPMHVPAVPCTPYTPLTGIVPSPQEQALLEPILTPGYYFMLNPDWDDSEGDTADLFVPLPQYPHTGNLVASPYGPQQPIGMPTLSKKQHKPLIKTGLDCTAFNSQTIMTPRNAWPPNIPSLHHTPDSHTTNLNAGLYSVNKQQILVLGSLDAIDDVYNIMRNSATTKDGRQTLPNRAPRSRVPTIRVPPSDLWNIAPGKSTRRPTIFPTSESQVHSTYSLPYIPLVKQYQLNNDRSASYSIPLQPVVQAPIGFERHSKSTTPPREGERVISAPLVIPLTPSCATVVKPVPAPLAPTGFVDVLVENKRKNPHAPSMVSMFNPLRAKVPFRAWACMPCPSRNVRGTSPGTLALPSARFMTSVNAIPERSRKTCEWFTTALARGKEYWLNKSRNHCRDCRQETLRVKYLVFSYHSEQARVLFVPTPTRRQFEGPEPVQLYDDFETAPLFEDDEYEMQVDDDEDDEEDDDDKTIVGSDDKYLLDSPTLHDFSDFDDFDDFGSDCVVDEIVPKDYSENHPRDHLHNIDLGYQSLF
ncbi:hypothetical protein H0H81_004177 [Sphagnurus paluster]|uniref:Uncharacterized protein n=1 Tax=Sphagnurus paluster TaxID=117069 RepID=A0A9P7K792_9AGAR|nr:hypothetical protein H0H81_004177 [Sphagnurus paluster]